MIKSHRNKEVIAPLFGTIIIIESRRVLTLFLRQNVSLKINYFSLDRSNDSDRPLREREYS